MLGILDVQDVIDEFDDRELPYTDVDNNNESHINESKIENAIMDAEQHISGYLRKVGIDISNITIQTKQELRRHALNITRYYMSDSNGITTENITERYKDSVNFLKDIASGKAVLNSSISKRATFSQIRMI